VTAEVAVDGAVHRVTWSAGSLALDDHGDADSELALAALGGGRCACLDILDAWNAQAAEPEVLTVGRRSLAEEVRADRVALSRLEREAAKWRAQWRAAVDDMRVAGDIAGSTRLRDVAERAERRLRVRLGFMRLLSLDDALVDRLQLTVLASAERRWLDDPQFRARHRARLHAALIARALPCLQEVGLAPDQRTEIELLDPGEPAVVRRGGRVALPLSWLTNVWGRGVAVDHGRFVTSVTAVLEDGKVLDVRGVDDDDWRITRA
jgi:hypothetical protein